MRFDLAERACGASVVGDGGLLSPLLLLLQQQHEERLCGSRAEETATLSLPSPPLRHLPHWSSPAWLITAQFAACHRFCAAVRARVCVRGAPELTCHFPARLPGLLCRRSRTMPAAGAAGARAPRTDDAL